MFRSLFSDIRFAARLVRRDPWFAVAAVSWLALGIGAVTTLFSLMNAVLKPLPFPEADEIVMLRSVNRPQNLARDSVSLPDFLDIREQAATLQQVEAFLLSRLDLPHAGGYQRLRGFFVTPGFFDVLRTPPRFGSPFSGATTTGTEREVIISSKLWKEHFDARTDVLGEAIDVNSWATFPDTGPRVYTVSGVLQEDFRCLPAAIFFEPKGVGPADRLDFCTPMDLTWHQDRSWRDLEVFARLKSGVSVQQAQAEMDVISARLQQSYPDVNTGWTIDVVPLHEEVFGNVGPTVTIMFVASLAVLLIACGNVANLYLDRTSRRQAEMAVRAAMGATPSRQMRQLATETCLLVLTSGTLGVALAAVAVDVLASYAPENLPLLGDVPLDRSVLLFAAAVTLASVLLVSIVPMWRVATPDLNSLLNSVGRTASRGRGQTHGGNVLMVAQLSTTFVLIAGASVLFGRFHELSTTDPGFDSSHRLSMTLSLPQATHEWIYNSTFCNQVLEQVAALPGVNSVAAVQGLPVDGTSFDCRIIVEGQPWAGTGGDSPALIRVISDNYFETMGIPLIAGRPFNETDSIGEIGGNRTVIINESAVIRCWPGGDAIGGRFKVHPAAHWMEVIGVVGDIRNAGLDAPITSDVYYPEKLYPQPHLSIVVHTKTDPLSLSNTVRATVKGVDADVYITDVATVGGVLSESLALRRYFMLLLSMLAGVGLVLAVGGVIITTLNSVSRRGREFGIRVACGAEPRHIRRLVLIRSGLLIAVGLAGGAGIAFAVVPPLIGEWQTVGHFHNVTLFVTPLVLGSAGLLACVLAAVRASRTAPMEFLRSE